MDAIKKDHCYKIPWSFALLTVLKAHCLTNHAGRTVNKDKLTRGFTLQSLSSFRAPFKARAGI